MRSTADDSVDDAVLLGTSDVFVFGFPIVIHEEVLVNDGVNVGVSQGFDQRLGEVEFMSFSVNRVGAEELLRLVEGFLDGEGPFDPVDRGVDFFQPWES